MKRLTLNNLTIAGKLARYTVIIITKNLLFVNTRLLAILLLLLFSPLHGAGSQPADFEQSEKQGSAERREAGPYVIFSEIAWMGTTASANKEWIELYNNTDSLIDLEGWQIKAEDGVPKINLTGQIAARGFYLLERARDDSLPGAIAQQIYAGALENSGENLRLFDEKGNLIDEIQGENGWPGGDNSTKQTLVREGSSWSTSAAAEGSPDEKNKALVPAESEKLESVVVNTENSVLALAALPSHVREVKGENSSSLNVLGLAMLMAALSGIAILTASRMLGIS